MTENSAEVQFVHNAGRHVDELADSVLILDVDELYTAVLDCQHGGRCDSGTHTASGTAGVLAPQTNANANFNQRQQCHVSKNNGFSHNGFGGNQFVYFSE